MARDHDADPSRVRISEPVRWLGRLLAVWDDQRADAALPDADELFLADLAEIVPNLVLAYRDDRTDCFRIDFAGAAARALLALEPVGTVPEHEVSAHPLAWLGIGFVRARRPAVPGPQWVRSGAAIGLFLPYGAFDGRVTLILAGVARWPAAAAVADGDGTVVPLRAPGR